MTRQHCLRVFEESVLVSDVKSSVLSELISYLKFPSSPLVSFFLQNFPDEAGLGGRDT